MAGLALMSACSIRDDQEQEIGFTVTAARCSSYREIELRAVLLSIVERLGALNSIRRGDRVLLKINLTGGSTVAENYLRQRGIVPWETYWTHVEVIRVMSELYRDAGATRIWVADALFSSASYDIGGYREKLSPLAELIDLDLPGPSGTFLSMAVKNPLRYPSFFMREEIRECDHLASISKMKNHQNCGVTLGLKNHIGLVPVSRYGINPGDTSRSLLHGNATETGLILPQGIADLNSARAIDFSLIDGIFSAEGGEGPWSPSFNPLRPQLLVAGLDAVATDAVCCYLMGYSPEAADYTNPFYNCLNHISLAGKHGLGQWQLAEILYTGPNLDQLRFPFRPLT